MGVLHRSSFCTEKEDARKISMLFFSLLAQLAVSRRQTHIFQSVFLVFLHFPAPPAAGPSHASLCSLPVLHFLLAENPSVDSLRPSSQGSKRRHARKESQDNTKRMTLKNGLKRQFMWWLMFFAEISYLFQTQMEKKVEQICVWSLGDRNSCS